MNRKILVGAVLSLLATIAVADGTRVLGIPFGEKLPYNPATCPFNTDKVAKICWVDTPTRYKDGWISGLVYIPGADSRPLWAAQNLFELSLKKDLSVAQIKVSTDGAERAEITSSITSRFGRPITSDQYATRWMHREANIELLCASPTKCWTTFRVPPTDEDLESTARRLQQKKPRPITP